MGSHFENAHTAPAFSETAHAKINLTLRVLGRRADGMHELRSIVVFADAGDRLFVTPRQGTAKPQPGTLDVSGPFAREIVGDNLVERAMRAVERSTGVPFDADVVLDKRMPVASGIGGGSADAAAMLRAMRRAGGVAVAGVEWAGIAQTLGADVPVCLVSRSTLMTGTGEKLRALDLPRLDIVLANAREPVPPDKTRRVFRALAAGPVTAAGDGATSDVAYDRATLIAAMRREGNDLEIAARSVLPSIATVKDAIAGSPGCEIAVLSGAGPTVAGLYASATAATFAAEALSRAHPGWWVQACTTVSA